jgi:hypothetical protein
VKNFLGRPQKVDALVSWMNQEFESQPQQTQKQRLSGTPEKPPASPVQAGAASAQ